MWTKNFGGIDSKATVLNIGDNEAADITNWNIGLSGAITRRDGTATLVTIGDNANPQIVWWSPFYDVDGEEQSLLLPRTRRGIWTSSTAIRWVGRTRTGVPRE